MTEDTGHPHFLQKILKKKPGISLSATEKANPIKKAVFTMYVVSGNST